MVQCDMHAAADLRRAVCVSGARAAGCSVVSDLSPEAELYWKKHVLHFTRTAQHLR